MNQRGSITAMVAVLATALFALAGLAIDGGRALAADQQAAAVAEEAARAGSQALSVPALRAGTVVVDPGSAMDSAQRVLAGAGLVGSVAVVQGMVHVEVTTTVPTTVLGIIGIATMTIHASAVATDVHGVTEGS